MGKVNKKTSEEIEAKREATKKLFNWVKGLSETELDFYQKKGLITIEGHNLSARNSALACMQKDNASVLGGYQQWKATGRQVKKGEKAISLLAPRTNKDSGDCEGFFFINMFDISQTELINKDTEQIKNPVSDVLQIELTGQKLLA